MVTAEHPIRHETTAAETAVDAHVVLLTNFIPPHVLPVLTELNRRVRRLTVLLSTPMESNRHWKPEWGGLDVRVQRTLTIERPWRHAAGFRDKLNIHIPWNTVSMLRELRPDVVVAGEMGMRSLLSACYAALNPRTRLIVYATLSEHTERGRGWLRYLLRRWLVRRAHFVAVNGSSAARYIRGLGADPRRISHVPYSAVPDVFDRVPPSREPQDAHRLLFIGQLVERKGLVRFLASLARHAVEHPQRQIEFDVVGSGPLEPALRAITCPTNLQVRFLGERTYAELPALCARAGILVFPTLADEWGLVVNEALSAGLPVLGSVYSQAVEELCIEGQTGWRFRPDESAEVYGAIDRALSTPAEALEEMRCAGRALVEKLSPAFAADRMLATIHASLAQRDAA